MEILLNIYVVLFGLILGSFIALAAIRLPLQESVVSPRSHCRYCDHVLRWYENIPILSYWVLGGKCRKCRVGLSLYYPAVEIMTAGLTYLAYLNLQPWPRFLLYLILWITPVLILSLSDAKTLILPDVLTLPGIVAGFAVHWVDGRYFHLGIFSRSTLQLLVESALGSAAGAATLFFLRWSYRKIRKKEGMGLGDVKFAAMIGACFGWKAVFFIFWLAAACGIGLALVLMLFRKVSKETPLPFGTCLGFASLLYLFYGETLLHAYLHGIQQLLKFI